MRAYIGTLSCKVYCLPATGGTWHGCTIIPVGTLPYMLHGDILHGGLHCMNAIQYGLHWTPYYMNAMHLIWQYPPVTGNTLVQ
ncbi:MULTISPECIES: hypothetical protein [Bacteroidaceae]|uniref:hypothetical protein n=1 Tax=Bacteroidaceae TaxID=815 RepID=UPI0005181492|nr:MULTISPECIES: hypothetical protein [Bacteroidaceae]MCB6720776.1 hypothetical protein [Bacteroides fragilis]MCQ5173350.1 hypothetical protein [Bacteroides fragilis]MCS2465309.1 hypothetical protein [Bacteroides thetaiotaomicron]